MRPSDLPDQNLQLPAATSLRALAWRHALSATLVALAALLGCYWESVVTMVQTWERSGTYTHGFIVFPISAWLIWWRRSELATITPRPFLPGLLMLGGLSIVWLLGHLAGVQTFQEFALVVSIPVLLWTTLGTQFASRFAFALAFMVFAWPFGEFLIPPLIDRTADFTVAALRLTGVPVYRQGNSFTIPTGSWSVIDACSGVRYLLASLCAGSAFAYLTYRSWTRRLVFMGASVAVPIVANWIRAYLIVLIGHLSENRLATGIDHLIYGWVFFGAVTLLLFYVGGRWSEPPIADPKPSPPELGNPRSSDSMWIVGPAAAMAFIAIGPGLALALQLAGPTRPDVQLAAPKGSATWQPIEGSVTSWTPAFQNPTAAVQQTYSSGPAEVQLLISFYRDQRPEAKLLTFISTTLSDYDAHWQVFDRKQVNVTDSPQVQQIIERRLQSSAQNLLIWQWYWVDGLHTTSVWRAKLAQVRARISRRGDTAAGITLVAVYRESPSAARQALRAFLDQMGPAIDRSLDDAAAR